MTDVSSSGSGAGQHPLRGPTVEHSSQSINPKNHKVATSNGSTSNEIPVQEPSAANQQDVELTREPEGSQETTPPPLPPRPDSSKLVTPTGSLRRNKLQGKPTTALSLTGVQTGATREDKHEWSAITPRTLSRRSSLSNVPRRAGVGEDDGASIQSIYSHAPTVQRAGELESLLGDAFGGPDGKGPGGVSIGDIAQCQNIEGSVHFKNRFASEFERLGELEGNGSNEGTFRSTLRKPSHSIRTDSACSSEALMLEWSNKLKHFIILSSAGKPVYSRHGDNQLISNTVGVIQTIISFYQDAGEILKSFTAGDTRFTLVSKGHLHLLATSPLDENDSQLQVQLEALYMQILSTLTLPNMEKLFSYRPSTDLRRPLQGTEGLLSALADGFTRGSPSTLLSSLECLRLRKQHRQVVNNSFAKVRSPGLLYGLIVAGGRLVSVLRPKKHSLHPGDLQLIFNMLFEARGVRTGGGENWIPLCLPGFNNTGYVYMYVSFLDGDGSHPGSETTSPQSRDPSLGAGNDDSTADAAQIAFILISASKEAFYNLRTMRDNLVDSLSANNVLHVIRKAASMGRPTCSEILPGTPLRHFLYKSRANVQFTMPAAAPDFGSPVSWRQLMSRYAGLHAAVHSKLGNAKVLQCVSSDGIALAWVSPVFEFFGVAAQGANRQAVAQGAAKAVQWAKREEQRLFVIGGAVSHPAHSGGHDWGFNHRCCRYSNMEHGERPRAFSCPF